MILFRNDGSHGRLTDNFMVVVTEKIQAERIEEHNPSLAIHEQYDTTGISQSD